MSYRESEISITGYGEYTSTKPEYKEVLKVPIVEPHCNCQECHEYSGKAVTTVVKYGFGICHPTKLAKDKETCFFCGHYVLWQEEGKRNRPRVYKKKTKEKTI